MFITWRWNILLKTNSIRHRLDLFYDAEIIVRPYPNIIFRLNIPLLSNLFSAKQNMFSPLVNTLGIVIMVWSKGTSQIFLVKIPDDFDQQRKHERLFTTTIQLTFQSQSDHLRWKMKMFCLPPGDDHLVKEILSKIIILWLKHRCWLNSSLCENNQ